MTSMASTPADSRRRNRRPPMLLALEPRMMFDGAAAGDAAHAAAQAAAQAPAADAAHDAPDAAAKVQIPDATAPAEVRAAAPEQNNGKKEVAFVDTSVADYQSLVAGIGAGVEIQLIDGGQSGLAQIAKWAETHSGYDAIHILSHGSAATLTLGTDTVTEGGLQSAVTQAELAQLGHALKAGGDLLLYGCDIGAGETGRQFLSDLSAATGADVAASTDATGAASRGGDWVLETAGPQVSTQALALAGYGETLADATFSFGTGGDDLAGGASTLSYTYTSGSVSETITLTATVGTSGPVNLYFAQDAASTGGTSILGDNDFSNMDGRVITTGLEAAQSVEISVTGKIFTLDSFSFYDFAESGANIILTTSKGSYSFTPSIGANNADQITNLANYQVSGVYIFRDVTSVIFTNQNGDLSPVLDNISLKNIYKPGANANDDTGTATEAGAAAGSDAGGNVIDNDYDTNSGTMTVTGIRTGAESGTGTGGTVGVALAGTYGTLTINANGSYTYVVNNSNAAVQALAVGQTLTESFTYTISGSDVSGSPSTDIGTLEITIDGANDAPVAANDSGSATEAGGIANGTAGSNATGNVLTNDTDPDAGATKTVSAVRLGGTEGTGTGGTVGVALTGTYGTLTLNSNGSYTYAVDNSNATVQALAAGQTLTESFNYTVSDGSATDLAVLTITINGANDAPVAANDSGSATEAGGVANGTAGSNATGNVLSNDTDPDSTMTVSAVRLGGTEGTGTGGTVGVALTGTYGTLTLNSNGSYTYAVDNSNATVQALAAGQTLTESFNYTVSDGSATDLAVLTITINGANDAPAGGDKTVTATEDTPTSSRPATSPSPTRTRAPRSPASSWPACPAPAPCGWTPTTTAATTTRH
ncbi:MAG: VCBS domain-containing protein [Magnetospirillum sp.]|nr:VCBS domain-containing protein [Magnetospirillum sp.]